MNPNVGTVIPARGGVVGMNRTLTRYSKAVNQCVAQSGFRAHDATMISDAQPASLDFSLIIPLTDQQTRWVDNTLSSMSIEQCVGHLMLPYYPGTPSDWGSFDETPPTVEEWIKHLEKYPLGSIYLRQAPTEEAREKLEALQKFSEIPLLVAIDLEPGLTGAGDSTATEFSYMMATGAADNPTLTYDMARAMAVEHRYYGLHWTFSPVIDPNLNFHNPITNVRSVGEHPELVERHVVPFIRGFQDGGVMAATAKHFPGDGLDYRDQHLATTVNHLPMEQWWETYGKIWQSAIDSGVMTVMPGHISLPDYQGFSENPDDAPPATLSRRLQFELLREELGFQGVVVSDATPMIGMTAWASGSERIVRNIQAGSDVYLFGDSARDFAIVMEAVTDGRLSEGRVRQSARRVLELKARVGLDHDPFGPVPTASQKSVFAATGRKLAESAVALLREDGRPPVALGPGAAVLTVTIKYDVPSVYPLDLDVVDEELRQRGLIVSHLVNPSNTELTEQAPKYAAVFVNMHVTPDMRLGTLRLAGGIPVPQWLSLHREHPQVVYTTFGNPYILFEIPQVNNLVATFGTSGESQRAAVRVWLGESETRGVPPFTQPKVAVRPIDLKKLNVI